MNMMEVIKARHSVRQFKDEPLQPEAVEELNREIDLCNEESGFHFQLITDEPEAFQAGKPSYGRFSGCRNYLTIIGPKGREEDAGYYGERILLKAQELGINSCWVALTYRKGKAQGEIKPGEKHYMVIALGYGVNAGTPHKGKTIARVSDYREGDPDWYRRGLKAAILAPTAINQQKFRFERDGEKVTAKVAGLGFNTRVDLGIVKYHFEVGSGKGKQVWK